MLNTPTVFYTIVGRSFVMRKFKYTLLVTFKGEVEAKDIPTAIQMMLHKFYGKMKNPEALDFQYMHFTIEEIK